MSATQTTKETWWRHCLGQCRTECKSCQYMQYIGLACITLESVQDTSGNSTSLHCLAERSSALHHTTTIYILTCNVKVHLCSMPSMCKYGQTQLHMVYVSTSQKQKLVHVFSDMNNIAIARGSFFTIGYRTFFGWKVQEKAVQTLHAHNYTILCLFPVYSLTST